MTRKFKLLILSLLGFSAACSGVKNNSKSQPQEDVDTMRTVVRPDIRLMYGVRRPVPVSKVDTLQIESPDKTAAKNRNTPEAMERQVEEQYPVVTMYGVRVPMENIDLDSLKRAQQERQQAAPQPEDNDRE